MTYRPTLALGLGALALIAAAVIVAVVSGSTPADKFNEVGYRISATSNSTSSKVEVRFRVENLTQTTATANCAVRIQGLGTHHLRVGPIGVNQQVAARLTVRGHASGLTAIQDSGTRHSLIGFLPGASIWCS